MFTREFLVVSFGILGGYLGITMCLGGFQGVSRVFWVFTRALLGVCIVARVFLGWSLGLC